jgi:anti-sigma factor RsiW
MTENRTIHEEKLEELSAYYGGDLSSEESAAFEAHLAECDRCRETLRVMKQTLPFAEQLLAFKPKQTIDEQVARFEGMWADKKARERAARRPRTRLWIGLALGMALAAVIAWAFLRTVG